MQIHAFLISVPVDVSNQLQRPMLSIGDCVVDTAELEVTDREEKMLTPARNRRYLLHPVEAIMGRSQWPRGPRRGSVSFHRCSITRKNEKN
jgi:hypothetical protein